MEAKQEDHILYKNGKFISLDKLKNYIKSRIKGEQEEWRSEGFFQLLEERGLPHFDLGNKSSYEMYMKYLGINYSNRINKQGVTIHNLNGMAFCSLEASGESYMLNDLKNDLGDYSKEKLFTNLKKNKNYTALLKKADAKSFENIEESNEFHFKLMQAVADQL